MTNEPNYPGGERIAMICSNLINIIPFSIQMLKQAKKMINKNEVTEE